MSALSVFRRALTTTQTSAESIAGTVVPHSTYLWLHSRTPVSAFPTRVQSPLVKNLQLKARDWDGLVNFSWSSGQSVHPSSPDLATQDLSQVHEVYHATAYSRNGLRLEIPSITLESADAVRAALSSLTSRHGDGLTTDVDKTVHLYVCTHGARDCRCGDTGGAVAQAIREELDSRRTRDKSGRWAQVRVREVAHIGGHKYAGNVLVYPSGDWLGNIRPEHVPELLDAVVNVDTRSLPTLSNIRTQWRGRMGLTKDEQLSLLDRHMQSNGA